MWRGILEFIETLFELLWFNLVVLGISFYILFKSADFFVESAVGISKYYNLPKMLVGIIIVGFGTTAPEIAVSAIASFRGHPEIAFGNAIGSVIVDDGVALALAGIISSVPILVDRRILKMAGLFLVGIDSVAFLLALNGRFSRIEGAILIVLLFGYLGMVYGAEKKRRLGLIGIDIEIMRSEVKSIKKIFIIFFIALGGVLFSSRLVVRTSVFLASYLGLSEAIIGLTVVAIGTSLPEISTCIVSARKRHGEIAIGDIVGADILNILWIIGVSSLIKPINIDLITVVTSFGFMFLVVGVMLISMRVKYRLTRLNGIFLLLIYGIYIAFNYFLYVKKGFILIGGQ
ncbi:MAG: hypothetical protein DRP54_00685 [Spirochaetes bacterium]|nr:MAG: hypothetical protein DRP54_00685 [Spirochaetota bacterium]